MLLSRLSAVIAEMKRYCFKIGREGALEEHRFGRWVLHKDVAELETQLAAINEICFCDICSEEVQAISILKPTGR